MVRSDLAFVRIMWIIAFTAGTAYCCYITVKSISDFFEFSVIDNNLIVNTIPVPFPAITICSLNPFNMKRLPQRVVNETLSNVTYNYIWPLSYSSPMNLLVS